MDRRSIFFGLGIGMIVASFVFFVGLAFTKDKQVEIQTVSVEMTNDEITEHARELGMVFIKELPQEAQKKETVEIPVKVEMTDEEIVKRAEELGYVKSEEIVEIEPEPDPEQVIEPTSAPQLTPEPEPISAEPTGDLITLVIPPGTNSINVSQIIFELGLVESAAAFNAHIINEGNSKKIIAGVYEIEKDAGIEEIALIITGKKR